VSKLTREEVVKQLKDATFTFESWYKDTLTYGFEGWSISIVPEYKDELVMEECAGDLIDGDDVVVYLNGEVVYYEQG
jgi:hypothetical protein